VAKVKKCGENSRGGHLESGAETGAGKARGKCRAAIGGGAVKGAVRGLNQAGGDASDVRGAIAGKFHQGGQRAADGHFEDGAVVVCAAGGGEAVKTSIRSLNETAYRPAAFVRGSIPGELNERREGTARSHLEDRSEIGVSARPCGAVEITI